MYRSRQQKVLYDNNILYDIYWHYPPLFTTRIHSPTRWINDNTNSRVGFSVFVFIHRLRRHNLHKNTYTYTHKHHVHAHWYTHTRIDSPAPTIQSNRFRRAVYYYLHYANARATPAPAAWTPFAYPHIRSLPNPRPFSTGFGTTICCFGQTNPYCSPSQRHVDGADGRQSPALKSKIIIIIIIVLCSCIIYDIM